jgi:class 3 adenylate cyclase/PAS domain-containing protein
MARLQDVTVEDHRPDGADVQLQVALDHMPGALVYTDKELNIVICNDRFKEMYRVPQELLQPGRPYPDFLRYLAEHGYYGEGDVDALVAQRVDSLRNPSGRGFEDHAPDGRWYRIVRRRAAGGGTVTVMTDITEQKQIEQDLAKKEAQFRVALGNMPGALVYTDKDLNIVFCNDRFKEMYDTPRDLLQPGRPYPDFLRYLAENGYYGEGDLDDLVARRVESLRNPSGRSFEDRTPDGRWLRIRRRRAAAGGAVTVMTEITEQKRAERELVEAKQRTEEANKLVIEKNRILEGLYAELQDKKRQVEEQAAELAEWNTTLESRVAEQVSQIGRYSRLTRFLSPKISDLIMSGETDDALKTRRAEITVVYVDLRGFTGFTETAEPEEVMSVLRQYHAELGRLVVEYDGTIEHIAGDGMMVLFNAPMPVENHELQAICMALAMRESLTALSLSWRKRGHELGFGAGIAGGYVTIGTIGFEQRLDYGAIGPACNLAARLCGEAKDTQILIAPRVLSKVEAHIEVEPVGDLVLKGFQRLVPAHNILGISRAGLGQSTSTNRDSAPAT